MIKLFTVNMSDLVGDEVIKTLYSGHVTEGEKVKEFERELVWFTDNQYTLAVNSGTSALTLACILAGGRPGRNIVSTPMTCSATNEAILASGATIVWADVDPRTGLIDPESVARVTNNNTVAVMGVDWGGFPIDVDELRKASGGRKIIEDAAHAFGSFYKDYRVGYSADYTCFSFQAIKHLTTVDGGALCVQTEADYKLAKKLRWFGIDRDATADWRGDTDIKRLGYKMHMNDVNATIGLANLQDIHFTINHHTALAYQYRAYLPSKSLALAPIRTKPNYWFMTFFAPPEVKAFKERMADKGVEVSKVHRRNDQYTLFKHIYGDETPGLDIFYGSMWALPINVDMTPNDVKTVCKAVRSICYSV